MANVKPPSICDFCGDKTPAKRLMGWPCATFEAITARYENAAYMVCACHTRDSLPPKAVIVERRNFIGSWYACPACRDDFTAGKWETITKRAQMTHRRRYGSQGLEAAALLVTGLHELFRVHATPPSEGSWQPVSLATVEIEVAAYEAQSGRKLS